MSITMLDNFEPQTEFAPFYKAAIWSNKFESADIIAEVRQWILDNEQRIKSIDIGNEKNDGGTGLDLDSVTANFRNFNLFHETKDIPAFQAIHDWLYEQYSSFMKELGFSVKDCLMTSWANILRKGESMELHHHGCSPYAYLSYNMHFGNHENITVYVNPVCPTMSVFESVSGGLCIFPSHIRHGVTEYRNDEPRVSIAGDLIVKEFFSKFDGAEEYPHVDFKRKYYE